MAGGKSRWADWRPPGAIPREPAVEPLFPIVSFTPDSACPHRGPISNQSKFLCMCCHCGPSRIEGHPALAVTPDDLRRLDEFDAEQPAGPTSYSPDPVLKGGLG